MNYKKFDLYALFKNIRILSQLSINPYFIAIACIIKSCKTVFNRECNFCQLILSSKYAVPLVFQFSFKKSVIVPCFCRHICRSKYTYAGANLVPIAVPSLFL